MQLIRDCAENEETVVLLACQGHVIGRLVPPDECVKERIKEFLSKHTLADNRSILARF